MNQTILNKADEIISSQISDTGIAGASLLIMQHGETVYRKNYGYASLETKEPLKDDAIFRCYSMTKPITAVATMILVERGIISLNDPVAWFIPSFQNQKVLENDTLVPVKRDVTILDLLTMTAGLVYPDISFPAGKVMQDSFDEVAKQLAEGNPTSTKDLCTIIGSNPLKFQPGEGWCYSTCADVLGGLIEILSGKKFSEFLQDEIFTPLGMKDTGFYVPEEKLSRFMGYYQYDSETNGLVPVNWQHLGLSYMWEQAPAFESGGAGLVSTVDDYSKFASMLLHNGTYNQTRILSRKSVEFMTQNHLTEKQLETYDWEALKGYGYGCLMRVMMDPTKTGILGEPGEFGWDGWSGNYVMMDPVNDLLMIYVIQKAGGNGDRAVHMLRNIVYSALD